MIDKHGRIRCDVCGRYISIKDLEKRKAAHYLRTPDSALTKEEWDSYCSKHVDWEFDK